MVTHEERCRHSSSCVHSLDPEFHALSVVCNSVLISVIQEYKGVYLRTFNLITGFNTDKQYVSMAAMDLIPPLAIEYLPDNLMQLSFYAKACEKGEVVKFSYMLRSGWDIDNAWSTLERQEVTVVTPEAKVLCVHQFENDEYPSLIYSIFDVMSRLMLHPNRAFRGTPITTYRAGFNDGRKLCAVTCKGSNFVVVDDKLSKFYRRRGVDFNAPAADHLSKAAVSMQIVHNRGEFFIAVNRLELYVVNERTSRFTKIPLPQGRVMGAGLVFDAHGDLILTDMKVRKPAPYRLPSRGIPSLQTICCLKVASMSPEETLFESREVETTGDFVRVLFMEKTDRIAYSTHLILPQVVGKPLPATEKFYSPCYSPMYRLIMEPMTMNHDEFPHPPDR